MIKYVLNSYKNSLLKFNDYLTNNGIINFNNFKIFMNDLSMKESEYFNEKSDFFKRILFSKKNNPTLKQSLFGLYKEENENYNKNKAIKNQYDKLKNVLNKSDLMIKKINYIKETAEMKNMEKIWINILLIDLLMNIIMINIKEELCTIKRSLILI